MAKKNNPNDRKSKKPTQLTPAELIKKHMKDPQSFISEEEMKNLDVGPEADKNIEQKEEEKLEELKKEAGKHPPNPYNILGS